MPKRLGSIPLALAAFLWCGAALAQEVASFTALSACRIDSETILLRATFDGGACQSVEPAALSEPRGTIIAVVIPTKSTSEMCTMQIVPIVVEQMIKAPEPVYDLDVTASDPNNNPVAYGLIQLDDDAKDCVAPKV